MPRQSGGTSQGRVSKLAKRAGLPRTISPMAEDREIEALKTQVTEMRLEMRLKALESNTADQRAPAPKSWWQTAAEGIAVPTAIVLLVFQITQVTGSFHTDRKTEVETTKLQADELKTRLETQKMLDELAASRAKGMRHRGDRATLDATFERFRAWRKAAGLSPVTSPTFTVFRSERTPADPAGRAELDERQARP